MRNKFLSILFLFSFGLTAQVTFIPPTYLPNPKAYGAKGDGVTNDSAAFVRWLAAISGGGGYIPAGVYMVNGLSIPEQTTIYGYGAWLKKNRNGNIATLADRVEIYGLKFHGNAPTYSGLGLVISAGNDQKLYGVEILYNDSFNLAIAKDVGLRFLWQGGQSIRYGSITNPSIKLGHGGAGQETNGDRTFTDLAAGGTWLIDVSYSQTTIINACNFVNLKFHDNASKTIVNGCRIATLGNDVTVKGTQCNLSGNIIAGGITIASGAQYNVFGNNTLTTGSRITDSSTNVTNSYTNSYTYTPTATNFTVGNGSLSATVNETARDVSVYMVFQTGSTSAYGTTSWFFSLPVVASNVTLIGGSCMGFNSGVNFFTGTVVGYSTSAAACITNATGNYWAYNIPTTWGGLGNSYIKLNIHYPK